MAEMTQPEITVTKGAGDFFEATVTIKNPAPMSGIPVQISVAGANESATVYTSSGVKTRSNITSATSRFHASVRHTASQFGPASL